MGLLDYAKRSLLLPTGAPVHDPSGAICPYEGGLLLWGLLEYSDETDDLVRKALNEFTVMQLGDGSWYQQYYPTRKADGSYDYTGTALRVDSGASLLITAMSKYDAKKQSTVFLQPVKRAFAFLRAAQVAHYNAYGKNLLANLISGTYPGGSWDTSAFAADCAEALIAATYALDAYGSNLTDSNGYSVKTFANNLYADCITFWKGGGSTDLDDNYYETAYPSKPEFPAAISFTQGLMAKAIHKWKNSAYYDSTKPDLTYTCKRALNYALALMSGKWGGFYYHEAGQGGTVYYGGKEEVVAYSACMALGMKQVDAVLYANNIARVKEFIRYATEDDGRVWNEMHPDGVLSLGVNKEFNFWALNTAYMLLVEALC